MERLTTNKNVSDMGMYELAHNCCYIAEDGAGMYRDYERDVDQRELVRELMKQLAQEDMPSNPISFDETMMDYLALNPCQDVSGLIALLYHNMWAMADLREKLKRYEDAEEQGLLLQLPCKVGDTVWDNDYGRPCAYTITAFSFGECEEYICEPVTTKETVFYYANSRGSITGSFAESEIGKSVFLNKSKAEAKLKEMEEKHGR